MAKCTITAALSGAAFVAILIIRPPATAADDAPATVAPAAAPAVQPSLFPGTWQRSDGRPRGIPIALSRLNAGVVVRLFDKANASRQGGMAGTGLLWREDAPPVHLDRVAPFGDLIEIDGRLLQSQTSPERKTWRILVHPLEGGDTRLIPVASYPEDDPRHHDGLGRAEAAAAHGRWRYRPGPSASRA